MVVIEEESAVVNDSKSQPDSAASGYTSDGYETASDTELNDNVPEPENHSHPDDNGVCNSDDISRSVENHEDEANRELKEEERQEKIGTSEIQANERAAELANDAKLEGNSLFKAGLYEEALLKYEHAIQIAEDDPSSSEVRSMCFANRGACFFKLGKYEETIKECTKALELDPAYVKALLRRGEAHEKLEHYEESIADMTKIVELDPSNNQAKRTIIRLKPLADEKREKMKEEMIGKLKEMGNSILGRFGMSVDNFKAVQDPNTGSYSISFQR